MPLMLPTTITSLKPKYFVYTGSELKKVRSRLDLNELCTRDPYSRAMEIPLCKKDNHRFFAYRVYTHDSRKVREGYTGFCRWCCFLASTDARLPRGGSGPVRTAIGG